MRFSRVIATGLTAAIVAGTVVWADAHNTPEAQAIKARQAHMDLYQHNAGKLFGFAKGSMDFDAGAAQTHADNLVALTSLSHAGYWLPGTSTDESDKTRALPAIWSSDSKAGEIGGQLRAAAAAMAANAGTLDGVRANIGAIGEACTACHKAYRQPE